MGSELGRKFFVCNSVNGILIFRSVVAPMTTLKEIRELAEKELRSHCLDAHELAKATIRLIAALEIADECILSLSSKDKQTDFRGIIQNAAGLELGE